MSSSGGGIVVHPLGRIDESQYITKAEGQQIADLLSSNNLSSLAAKIQAVVDLSS